ncbi:MAG: site-specific integrase, partial [Planctomycetota bacterium]
MPRLFHRPPKYCLHKGTKQATVSLFGKRIYLGPYGSRRSHEAYQQVLRRWHDAKDQQSTTKLKTAIDDDHDVKCVTAATLRAKRLSGLPVTISELALVF